MEAQRKGDYRCKQSFSLSRFHSGLLGSTTLDTKETLYSVQITGLHLFKITGDLPATPKAPSLRVRCHVNYAADRVPEPQMHISIFRKGLALKLNDFLRIAIVI